MSMNEPVGVESVAREAPPPPRPGSVDASVSSGPGSLELRSLEKRFGRQREVVAVRDVSLHVRSGEFVTLLGPSGSGKTTTLLMVAGFEPPTAGEIILDGKHVTTVRPHKRGIGMVFQNYALFPHMTVFENVAFPLRRRSVTRRDIEHSVARVLELMQLEGLDRRYPRELSGGQQQRVALARATVFGPSLLLMDEPLSALDKKLRQEMQLELRRIHRDLGTSVMYVTHDQEEALALSDSIVLMRDGGIEQIGSARDLYQRPQTEFAAGFLGESNFLGGRAVDGADGGGSVVVELTNGARVRGVASSRVDAGAAVSIVLRPEHLKPAHGGATEGCVIDVRVGESVYLGDRVRCSGQFATGERCLLQLEPAAAGELIARGGASMCWDPTDAVVVRGAG
jgi:putative spermidine/putrescine transport system ATP-binding protein